MPSCALGALPHVRHRLPDVVGQGAAVRVAQHQRLGPCFLGRGEDGQGEVRIAPVAVEEVLGVEEDAQVVLAQEAYRVGHHGHRLVEGGPQGLGHVTVPRLGDNAGDRRPGLDQVGQDGVGLGLHARPPGGAESHQGGGVERQLLLGPLEELDVLGVGAGPTALDEGDAEMVELLGHPQLVVDREGEALLLAAVTEDRVEDVHGLGQVRDGEIVGVGAVAVRMGVPDPAVAVGGVTAFSRHGRAIPCTGRPRPARWRSRSAGSPW